MSSKKLISGRFQVNFSTEILSRQYYGYLLAESKTPVREVIEKISRHIDEMQFEERYMQRNLFSLTNRQARSGKILIFKAEKGSERSDRRNAA